MDAVPGENLSLDHLLLWQDSQVHISLNVPGSGHWCLLLGWGFSRWRKLALLLGREVECTSSCVIWGQGTGASPVSYTHVRRKGLCWGSWPGLVTTGLWEFLWNWGTFNSSCSEDNCVTKGRNLVQKYVSDFQTKNETVRFAFVSLETWRAALSRQHRQGGWRSSGPGKQLPTFSSGSGPLCVLGYPSLLAFVVWNTIIHSITKINVLAKIIKTYSTQPNVHI